MRRARKVSSKASNVFSRGGLDDDSRYPGRGPMIRAAIIGATGRMGQALVRAGRETNSIRITAAVASEKSPHIGRDIGQLADQTTLGTSVTSDLRAALAACDVAMDFSQPGATAANLAACRAANKPLLIGTTGFPSELTSEF